jgi:2-amino-4-hydroxy-6-hydroxymethyldihydropteridine diphosphokinase
MDVKAALGLGSNLGDRNQNIITAIEKIEKHKILHGVKVSSLLTNKALLPDNVPDEWRKDFVNCVVSGYTTLEPEELLQKIKEIERRIGRTDPTPWMPRVIDIDILIYGELDIKSHSLVIPHPGLLYRKFACTLLAEIEPDLLYPGRGRFNGETMKEVVRVIYGQDTNSSDPKRNA